MSNKRKHTGSESADERPVKSSSNEETKQNDDEGGKQSQTTKKSTFAQSFAYLKNTDMYKLPEKPVEVPQAAPRNSNSILVNSCQRGNPILKFVKNVPWEFGDIIPDYQIGERHCALFLSLRYHNLNPNYVHERLALLGNNYDLRVILVQVDIKNCKHNLKELSKMCMLAGCTLILAWSAEEAGRYLETYKQYENKPPDILQERVERDYFSQLQDVLTTVKSINKTDAVTLLSAFGSLRNIINASKEEIVLCPGFGQQKAQRLHKVFNEPFKRNIPNVSSSEAQSSPCMKDGQLPSTSKLKRPSEINISLRKNESQSPKRLGLKCSNLEKEEVIHAESNLLSPKSAMSVEQSTMQSKDDKLDSLLKEKSNKGTPTDKRTDNLVVNQTVVHKLFEEPAGKSQPSPRKSDTSDYLSTKDIELQKSSKTTHQGIKSTSSKMTKTEAVLNSGLSRYKKEERTERDSKKSSPQKSHDNTNNDKYPKSDQTSVKKTHDNINNDKYPKSDKTFVKKTHDNINNDKYPKSDKTSVKKTQDNINNDKYPKSDKTSVKKTHDKPHNEKHSRTDSHTYNKQHEKHKSRNNSESSQDSSNSESSRVANQSKKLSSPLHNSTSKYLDKSDVCGKTKRKDSLSESVSNKVTSRTLTADKDILLTNESKFRVGSRTHRFSQNEDTPKDNTYSTQINDDEFNDLLASDDDDDDIDIYADIL